MISPASRTPASRWRTRKRRRARPTEAARDPQALVRTLGCFRRLRRSFRLELLGRLARRLARSVGRIYAPNPDRLQNRLLSACRYYHGTRTAPTASTATGKPLQRRLGREGFEPSTLGLRVPCS